jgi:hypothetical protein
MKLYNYFRSSASYRVRIALALKQLPFDYVPVHLLKGEHKRPEFAALSADTFVPVLEDGGQQLSQSLALCAQCHSTISPHLGTTLPPQAGQVALRPGHAWIFSPF